MLGVDQLTTPAYLAGVAAVSILDSKAQDRIGVSRWLTASMPPAWRSCTTAARRNGRRRWGPGGKFSATASAFALCGLEGAFRDWQQQPCPPLPTLTPTPR